VPDPWDRLLDSVNDSCPATISLDSERYLCDYLLDSPYQPSHRVLGVSCRRSCFVAIKTQKILDKAQDIRDDHFVEFFREPDELDYHC
jgi:hypothetical protein